MSRSRRGFTLSEILVVAFLSVVVLGLMIQLLVPSIMLFRVESAATEAQQAAFIVVGRVSKALMNTQLNTVTLLYDVTADNPVAVSYQEVAPADPISTEGRPKFLPRFSLYYWNRPTGRIVYEETPDSPMPGHDWSDPQVPQRLSLTELRAYCTVPNGEERVVARNVVSFVVTDQDGDVALVHPPLVIEVTCQVEAPRGGDMKYETFVMKTQITPRIVAY
jgi:hypothetical protein